MPESARPPILGLSILASALLHAGGGAVVVSYWPERFGSASARRDLVAADVAEPVIVPEEDPQLLRLGDESSEAVSMNWLGFNEYEEHSAEPGRTDQPELTLQENPGLPGVPGTDSAPVQMMLAENHPKPSPAPPVEDPSTPQPIAARETAEADSGTADPELEVGPPAAPEIPPQPLIEVPSADDDPEGVELTPTPIEGSDLLSDPQEEPEPSDKKTPTEPEVLRIEGTGDEREPDDRSPPEGENALPSPQPEIQPEPQLPAETSGSAGSPGTGGQASEPGTPSDRESSAFSRIDIGRRQLGQPIAGKGLEIKTVRPRFSQYTRLTAAPRHPIVRVEFLRDGTVFAAKLVRSSGVADVDRPILDALHQWTASGEEIRKLPVKLVKLGEKPPTLPVEFRILL